MLFCIAIYFLIQVPAVQTYVVKKASNYFADKWKVKISIGYVKLWPINDIELQNFAIYDQSNQLMAKFKSCDLKIDLLDVLNPDKNIKVKKIGG